MTLRDSLSWQQTRHDQKPEPFDSARNGPSSAAEDASPIYKQTEGSLSQTQIPILPIAAALFVLSFTGASLYGIRAGRKAELKEAAQRASEPHAAKVYATLNRPKPPSVLRSVESSSSHISPLSSSSSSSAQSLGTHWDSSVSAVPAVLSRRGGSGRLAREAYAASPDARVGLNSDESPVFTAIKAFAVATALVGVTSAATIEIARRVWKIEDMYDLTDRFRSLAPKSFFLFESIGEYMRSYLGGMFPTPENDEDPFASPVPTDQSSDHGRQATHEATASSIPWIHRLFKSSTTPSAPPLSMPCDNVKSIEEVFEEIEQASTMRERLELMEVQLRREKAQDDHYREGLRRQREKRSAARSNDRQSNLEPHT